MNTSNYTTQDDQNSMKDPFAILMGAGLELFVYWLVREWTLDRVREIVREEVRATLDRVRQVVREEVRVPPQQRRGRAL